MSAKFESSSELADADAAEPGGGNATGPGQAGAGDAADAAGVGDIPWAADGDQPNPSTSETPGHDGGAGAASAGVAGSNADGPPAADAANGEQGSDGPLAGESDLPPISAEDLVQDLERVTVERDQYLDASRRLQAELENYRKAVAKREVEARERANESLIAELLPVLDACDGALATGASDVEPVRSALVDTLTKQGLTRIDEAEAPFDPECHEAVMHEPDADGNGPVVAEVMRAGYLWKGRVVRPAMVRVRG